jgi:NAD+ kinase
VRIAYHVKRTGWQALSAEKEEGRLKRLYAKGDPTARRLHRAHEAHHRTLAEVHEAFASLGLKVTAITPRTKDLSRDRFDLVVTVGGDGTLLRASHRVLDVPVLGINSDPNTSVGFFCGVRPGEVLLALERALDGRLARRTLTRMQVTLQEKVLSKRVLNDALFCHQSPAATSRYLVQIGKASEDHKSSGFWIGPAAGSTAAQRSAGGRVLALESQDLQFVVREPYNPTGERYELKKVVIGPKQVVIVRSKMREGALFLDGHDDIRPRFGDVLTFRKSDEPLYILGIGGKKRSS